MKKLLFIMVFLLMPYGAIHSQQIANYARTGNLNAVKQCVSNGADVNARNGGALMRASSNGHLDIVKYLIEKGADVNAKDYGGDTALMGASSRGYLEVVKYLIEKGADTGRGRDNDNMFAVGSI